MRMDFVNNCRQVNSWQDAINMSFGTRTAGRCAVRDPNGPPQCTRPSGRRWMQPAKSRGCSGRSCSYTGATAGSASATPMGTTRILPRDRLRQRATPGHPPGRPPFKQRLIVQASGRAQNPVCLVTLADEAALAPLPDLRDEIAYQRGLVPYPHRRSIGEWYAQDARARDIVDHNRPQHLTAPSTPFCVPSST